MHARARGCAAFALHSSAPHVLEEVPARQSVAQVGTAALLTCLVCLQRLLTCTPGALITRFFHRADSELSGTIIRTKLSTIIHKPCSKSLMRIESRLSVLTTYALSARAWCAHRSCGVCSPRTPGVLTPCMLSTCARRAHHGCGPQWISSGWRVSAPPRPSARPGCRAARRLGLCDQATAAGHSSSWACAPPARRSWHGLRAGPTPGRGRRPARGRRAP